LRRASVPLTAGYAGLAVALSFSRFRVFVAGFAFFVSSWLVFFGLVPRSG
jgi:hypothetical protein